MGTTVFSRPVFLFESRATKPASGGFLIPKSTIGNRQSSIIYSATQHLTLKTQNFLRGLCVLRGELNSAECRESAIYRHNNPCNKLRRVTDEPEHRSRQILRLTKSSHWRVADYRFTSRGQLTCFFIGQ